MKHTESLLLFEWVKWAVAGSTCPAEVSLSKALNPELLQACCSAADPNLLWPCPGDAARDKMFPQGWITLSKRFVVCALIVNWTTVEQCNVQLSVRVKTQHAQLISVNESKNRFMPGLCTTCTNGIRSHFYLIYDLSCSSVQSICATHGLLFWRAGRPV